MIEISAQLENRERHHQVMVRTNGMEQQVVIPAKANGSGSSINGGELLFLALATCYCNDLYREAAKRDIRVQQVEVSASGTFKPEPGSIAEGVRYDVTVQADIDEQTLLELIQHTDTVAEIQNTLRAGTPVILGAVHANRSSASSS